LVHYGFEVGSVVGENLFQSSTERHTIFETHYA